MSDTKHLFSILGAGKFGTALAHVISKNVNFGNQAIRFYDIKQTCQKIDANFIYSNDLKFACFHEQMHSDQRLWIVIAVPASQVYDLVSQIVQFHIKNVTFILTSKGTAEDGQFLPIKLHGLLASAYSNNFKLAAIAGPHFAQDLIDNQPTLTSIAINSTDTADLKSIFHSINPIFTDDVLALQILCVMKNIAAYCCGMGKRMQLSESSQAALFGLCISDAYKLLNHYNCKQQLPAPVLADWILCCTSSSSRNYAAGLQNTCTQDQLTESLRSAAALRSYLETQNVTLHCLKLMLEPAENFINTLSNSLNAEQAAF